MTEYRKPREQGLSEEEILVRVSAGVEAGTLTPIPSGAMFYALSGPDKEHADLLVVMRLPDATAESTGLSTEPSDDSAWLMFPGTHQAHVMFGSPPYWWSPNKHPVSTDASPTRHHPRTLRRSTPPSAQGVCGPYSRRGLIPSNHDSEPS